jgi:hypothetical protein
VLASGNTYTVKGFVGEITTTNATPTTIASFTPADNSAGDWSVSVLGLDVTGAPPINGGFYRADLTFTATRVGAAAPTLTPSSPSPANVRDSGSGAAFSVSASVVGNAIVIAVTGAAATDVDWSVIGQLQTVT